VLEDKTAMRQGFFCNSGVSTLEFLYMQKATHKDCFLKTHFTPGVAALDSTTQGRFSPPCHGSDDIIEMGAVSVACPPI
jgi:hypothetical protein